MTPEDRKLDLAAEQAAIWFSRRRSGHFNADDEAELQTWLSADPVHSQTYAEMNGLWQELGQIPRPAITTGQASRSHWYSRLPALAASLVISSLALLGWHRLHEDNSQLISSNEPREIVLDDGSHVFLNRATSLRVRFNENSREIELQQGQAFFSVAHEKLRPFVVLSGETNISVLGTRFDVRRSEHYLNVSVQQGRVKMSPGHGQAPSTLQAGDQASFAYRNNSLTLRRVTADTVAQWRQGRLDFQQRPLDELVDELSLYRSAPVVLLAASLAQRKISGSIDTARPDVFLQVLPSLLPVKVTVLADGTAQIEENNSH